MSTTPSHAGDKPADLERTLYRYGLSLTVIFDLLVAKGIVTKDEIQRHAQSLNHELLFPDSDDHSSI